MSKHIRGLTESLNNTVSESIRAIARLILDLEISLTPGVFLEASILICCTYADFGRFGERASDGAVRQQEELQGQWRQEPEGRSC